MSLRECENCAGLDRVCRRCNKPDWHGVRCRCAAAQADFQNGESTIPVPCRTHRMTVTICDLCTAEEKGLRGSKEKGWQEVVTKPLNGYGVNVISEHRCPECVRRVQMAVDMVQFNEQRLLPVPEQVERLESALCATALMLAQGWRWFESGWTAPPRRPSNDELRRQVSLLQAAREGEPMRYGRYGDSPYQPVRGPVLEQRLAVQGRRFRSDATMSCTVCGHAYLEHGQRGECSCCRTFQPPTAASP